VPQLGKEASAMIRKVSMSTAMVLLLHASTVQSAEPICGDVNSSGTLSSSDALLVLKGAVGQPVTLQCPAIDELVACTDDLSTTNADLGTCQTNLDECEGGSGGGSNLPATGQTVCYSSEGSVVACSGTGQDGDLKAGVARSFIDNGDGTITDDATGLTWEKLDDAGGLHDKDAFFNWEVAIAAKIDELNFQQFGGYQDWRLPNRIELDSIVNLQAYNPAAFTAFNNGCVADCTVFECSCTRSDIYWTSTTYQHLASIAWVVNFIDGLISTSGKGNPQYVRAVRSDL